jgi:hypothetical protein
MTPFTAHLEQLQFFLARRADIVERIQEMLNAQRKPLAYLQDRALLSRQFEDSVFRGSGATEEQWRLRGRLEEAHWAGGFQPRDLPGLHNGLADPAEMMVRAFHLWQQTRWPGRNGRVRYAHTLFNLYVIRHLALLGMRLWDADAGSAGERLARIQDVLDQLWAAAPADQPVLLRDARWLLQMAQSPATDALAPYFDVARKIAETLPEEDRIEIHKAGVRMAGGHLRSQIRYYSLKKGVPLDDPGVVVDTRTSNALDFALLIQELVPLLAAYERAAHDGDRQKRRELADAICQGISPDPELFVNRVALLGAYSMIEHLFIEPGGDGQATYTAIGRRHVELIDEYEARIGRAAPLLFEDCPAFRPLDGAFSPFGVLYGFSSDLIEHMALKAVQTDAVTRFSLEDVFAAGDAEKLAWVRGWRNLPHLTPEVQKRFSYPQQFAEDIFDRLEEALRGRVCEGAGAVPSGRLVVLAGDGSHAQSTAPGIPDLPVRYVISNDERRVASDRREGKCVVSYRLPGGWVAIDKAMLTEVLGAGRDATIAALPAVAARTLKLMCRDLVVLAEDVTPRREAADGR